MEVIRELDMRNETVRLDGRHFIDCTFTDCILEYGGSEMILERTTFTSCRHVFFGHAFMTLQYLKVAGVAPWMNLMTVSETCLTVC